MRCHASEMSSDHWVTAFATTTITVRCLIDGYAQHGAVMLAMRIPFDLYPILLQRRNRGRVTQLMKRRSGAAV